MTREERLRAALPAAGDDLIARLAARPKADVDDILAALRQARRAGRDHEAAVRRQRKADSRKYGHYDESQLEGRNARMLDAAADRASRGNIDALASLANFERSIPGLKRLAVEGLRARGYSDPEIAAALGTTRQAVGQHFGRKDRFTPDGRETGCPA